MNIQIDPTRLARLERDAAQAVQFATAGFSTATKVEYDYDNGHDDGLVHNHDWATTARAKR